MFIQSHPFLNSSRIIPLVQCLLAGALTCNIQCFPGGISAAVGERNPLRVLIVTGGHDFRRTPFLAMFQAMPGIQWTEAMQPSANDLCWTLDEFRKYDVIVLYDFVQEISEGQKLNMVRLLKEEGKGLVGLHHCIQQYARLAGISAIFRWTLLPVQAVRGDRILNQVSLFTTQRFTVQIALRTHPITEGLKDFEIDDERLTKDSTWLLVLRNCCGRITQRAVQ